MMLERKFPAQNISGLVILPDLTDISGAFKTVNVCFENQM